MTFKEDFLFVSFYTKHKKYKDYADRLLLYFNKYKLSYYIYKLEHESTKLANCLKKPIYIQKALLEFNMPIIWVDIDSIINQDPIELNTLNILNFDIGLVYTPLLKHPVTDAIHIYNNTDNAKKFLDYRVEMNNDKFLTNLDHHRLDAAFYKFKDSDIKIINIKDYVKDWFTAVFSKNEKRLNF